ncbi:hypothetical protein ACFLVN_02080 [Chloroflexota bacterium]
MTRLINITIAILLLLCMVTTLFPYPSVVAAAQGSKMYWTDYGNSRIHRANLDGSDIENLVTVDDPYGIALDVAGGKMYYTDPVSPTGDNIQRANLDGSNVENLVIFLGNPSGIALDIAGGKMYWADPGASKIQRADLNGSNVEDQVTGLGNPSGIALDMAGGKMYWTDYGTGMIQRADLGGTNIQNLVTTGLNEPRGIALDLSQLVGGEAYPVDKIAVLWPWLTLLVVIIAIAAIILRHHRAMS